MPQENRPLRFAVYTRYSHREQDGGNSLAIQERITTEFVAGRGGVIVASYVDEALSATSMNKRAGLKALLDDAEQQRFDAVVVYRWDRLSRSVQDHTYLDIRLRKELGILLFSATEASEDADKSDGIEAGISKLLAAEESRRAGTRYRDAKMTMFKRGYYTGNVRPFGYDLRKDFDPVTHKQIGYAHLVVNESEAEAVRWLYETYAEGNHSFTQLAHLLNEQGFRTTKSRLHSHDGIREMLQSVIYIGKITHRQGLPDGTVDYNIPLEMNDAVHDPIIDLELWEKVQAMKVERRFRKQDGVGGQRQNVYLLEGLVWCWHCWQQNPDDGKCFCHTTLNKSGQEKSKSYVCSAKRKGRHCEQGYTNCAKVDDAVINLLFSLRLSAHDEEKLIHTVAGESVKDAADNRFASIQNIINSMGERIKQGYVLDLAEFEKYQSALAEQVRQLKPSPGNNQFLEESSKLVKNFRSHFALCEGDIVAKNRLVNRLIDRVFIVGSEVKAVEFKGGVYQLLM